MAKEKKIKHKEHKSKHHFDVNNKNLEHLKLIIVLVKKGHGDATNQLLLENGVVTTTMHYVYGTNDNYVKELFGGSEDKTKEGILAVVSESKYKQVRDALENRFLISSASKGVLLTFDISSMAGVLAYKFLTDYEGAMKYGK